MTNYFTCKCKVATMNGSYPSIPKDKQEGMVILTGNFSTVMSCIMNIIKFLFEDQISCAVFGTSSNLSSSSPHLFSPSFTIKHPSSKGSFALRILVPRVGFPSLLQNLIEPLN
jgi:hypothetical protein